MVKFMPRSDVESGAKEFRAAIPSGLIAVRGFTEAGVSDDNNFVHVKEALATYTQRTYPKLVMQILEPFGPEPKIKVPDILRKKKKEKKCKADVMPDEDDEGEIDMKSEAGKLLQQQIVKQYSKDCVQLEDSKLRLAGDIWSILGRHLQERIRLKSSKEISDEKRMMDKAEDEYDEVQFASEHSHLSLVWLWRSVVQIMNLGETAT